MVSVESDRDGDTAFDRARALYQSGQIAEARTLLEQALETDPDSHAIRYALGLCLNDLGEHAAAEPHLSAVVLDDPAQYLAAYQLGLALQAMGRRAEAAAAFRLVVARKNVPDAWRRLRDCESPDSAATTLAADVDERGLVSPGKLLLRTNTKRRHLAPSAIVAITLACVWFSAIDARKTLYGIVGAVIVIYAVVAVIAVGLQSELNTFEFYERRVDIHVGVLFRRHQVIWYYGIFQIQLTRGPVSQFTHTASLTVLYFQGTANQSIQIDGIDKPDKVLQLYEDLQPLIIRERRAVKKILM